MEDRFLQELVDAPMVRAATSAAIHKGRSLAWFETALEGVWVDPDRDNDDKTTQLVRIQKIHRKLSPKSTTTVLIPIFAVETWKQWRVHPKN